MIAFRDINIHSYLVMGIITSVAGLIEVISCLNAKTIRETIEDGKEIVETMKGEEVQHHREEIEEPVEEVRRIEE